MSAGPWPPSLHLVGSKSLGGAERWLQRFAAALAARGGEAALGVRAGSALVALDMNGLPLHELPFRTVWDPLSRHAVTRLVRALRPAIVQTYMGRATRLTRLPVTGASVHVARLGGYYRLAPYRHAHAWIGNTRGLCDWMIAQGLPAAQVHQIYNFVEVARPRPAAQIDALRAALAIPPESWVLLTPGRMIEVKGHRTLLAALSRLPAAIDGRPWHLVLLGDGPLRAGLERQARQAGIAGRIRWPGWQTPPDAYLQLADLVVFPSQDAETFGNVILDAWAWRRPLLVTRFRGAREIVRHGEDAWAVPCDTPEALADGLRRLLTDAGLRQGLAAAGATRAAGEFAEDAIMARYLALYRQLTGA